MEKQIEVWRWTSNEACEKEGRKDIGTMGGFFQDGMRWKDYVEAEPLPIEYAEAIRRSVLANNIRKDGGWHQMSEEGIPLFTDGKYALMSMRAWGDLLAAIWSEHDNADYNYMDFYCGGLSMRAMGPGYVPPPQPSSFKEALEGLFEGVEMKDGGKYNFPVFIMEDGRSSQTIADEYQAKHGHGIVLSPVVGCEACKRGDGW